MENFFLKSSKLERDAYVLLISDWDSIRWSIELIAVATILTAAIHFRRIWSWPTIEFILSLIPVIICLIFNILYPRRKISARTSKSVEKVGNSIMIQMFNVNSSTDRMNHYKLIQMVILRKLDLQGLWVPFRNRNYSGILIIAPTETCALCLLFSWASCHWISNTSCFCCQWL